MPLPSSASASAVDFVDSDPLPAFQADETPARHWDGSGHAQELLQADPARAKKPASPYRLGGTSGITCSPASDVVTTRSAIC